MALSGDFAKLRDLTRKVSYAASPDFRREMTTVLASTARTQLVKGFKESKAPSGESWAPLAEGNARDWQIAENLVGAERTRDRARDYEHWQRAHQRVEKLRRANAKPLLDTGRLRNSFSEWSDERGFTLTSVVKYASVHQTGTDRAGRKRNVRIPARPMVPQGQDLGTWEKPLARQADAVVRKAFK